MLGTGAKPADLLFFVPNNPTHLLCLVMFLLRHILWLAHLDGRRRTEHPTSNVMRLCFRLEAMFTRFTFHP